MKTEIAYILDRSGSMASVWSDAIDGLKGFVKDQQQISGECRFSLVVFDNKYDLLIDGQDLNTVSIDDKAVHIYPRGMTALYDAIGKTVNAIGFRLNNMEKSQRPEKVIVVIMTDGYENCSKEFSHSDVKNMIEHQESKYSWEFIYMGAGVDKAESVSLGFKMANINVVAKSNIGFAEARAYASSSTAEYRTKKE